MERKIYAPGVYDDISNEDYHSSIGISRSGISALQLSPLDYWEQYLDPTRTKEPPTKAMTLGSAVHTLVLEPHKFSDEFFVFTKHQSHPNTTIAKEHKKFLLETNKEKAIIEATGEYGYDLATRMSDAVLNHPKAAQLLNGASVETSIYWIDEESGVLCKTRPDIWNKKVKIIADLKTARDARPRFFARTVEDGNYHIQAAMQIDGIYAVTGEQLIDFFFIAVQNEPPYKPYIYRLEQDVIESGRREYKEALKVFSECIRTNDWSKDREAVFPVFFNDYQLRKASFYKLSEIYQTNL